MNLINVRDQHGNWWEVLSLWSRVVNWSHYQTSDRALLAEIKSLIGFLWNEKDWLKSEYPTQASQIEMFVNNSKHIRVVADLANTLKHRTLTRRPRSQAQQTAYFGRVQTGRSERQLYFISIGDGQHREIMEILRGAIDEYDVLRHDSSVPLVATHRT